MGPGRWLPSARADAFPGPPAGLRRGRVAAAPTHHSLQMSVRRSQQDVRRGQLGPLRRSWASSATPTLEWWSTSSTCSTRRPSGTWPGWTSCAAGPVAYLGRVRRVNGEEVADVRTVALGKRDPCESAGLESRVHQRLIDTDLTQLICVNRLQCEKPLKTLPFRIGPDINGEGGIRTRGKVLPLRRFSKAVLSTTQPPLRQQLPFTLYCHRHPSGTPCRLFRMSRVSSAPGPVQRHLLPRSLHVSGRFYIRRTGRQTGTAPGLASRLAPVRRLVQEE